MKLIPSPFLDRLRVFVAFNDEFPLIYVWLGFAGASPSKKPEASEFGLN